VPERVNKKFSTTHRACADAKRFHAETSSTFGWVTRQVGPTTALAHSMLGRASSSPGTLAFTGIGHAWRFLLRHPDVTLNFVRDRPHDFRSGDCPRHAMASDAAFADDEVTRKSQGAWARHFANVNTFDSHCSAKSSRVATSTCHAETIFAASAAKQATQVRNFLLWLRLAVEANQPGHRQSKHRPPRSICCSQVEPTAQAL